MQYSCSGGGGRSREDSGVMKWPDTHSQEARGEGPKPLPKVRQVWWQAPWPWYLLISILTSNSQTLINVLSALCQLISHVG